MIIIGIDPGSSGGLVAIDADGLIQDSIKMPEDPRLIREFIYHYQARLKVVVIELIPKWCGPVQFEERMIPGSVMATLFGNYKLCVGICVGLGVPWRWVAPVRWQNLVGCRNTERLPRAAWKRRLQAHAQGLADEPLSLWAADAFLIAWSQRK